MSSPTPSPMECTTPDGWLLRGDALSPPAPRAAAVLAHAMMVDRRTMDRPRGEGLASALAARGIAVMSFDLRGHGESGPTARQGASYAYDDFVNRDLPAIVGFARDRFPDLPLALVGHSLGAHAGLFAAGLYPSAAPDGIVSIAGNVWLPRFEPSLARRAAKRAVFDAWQLTSTVLGGFDPRPIRFGTDAEPLAYIRQLTTSWRADRMTSLDGRRDYLAALARVTVPVLAVSSEGDRLMAHPAAVDRFLALLERATVTHRVVTAADVGGPAPGHMELVTRPASRPIWSEIASFILALRPAGAGSAR